HRPAVPGGRVNDALAARGESGSGDHTRTVGQPVKGRSTVRLSALQFATGEERSHHKSERSQCQCYDWFLAAGFGRSDGSEKQRFKVERKVRSRLKPLVWVLLKTAPEQASQAGIEISARFRLLDRVIFQDRTQDVTR